MRNAHHESKARMKVVRTQGTSLTKLFVENRGVAQTESNTLEKNGGETNHQLKLSYRDKE